VLPVVDDHNHNEGFTDPEPKFKTPSLRFVAGTPPYFHDGSAETLADLVEQDKDTMGKTSHLSDEDKAALVAFLETL
jgi:cytochrome c peroxidase